MIEVEQRRLEREKADEVECQKKFKATPPPAHIYVPLFDDIMESQEQRRRDMVQRGREMIASIVRPFDFTKRDEERLADAETPPTRGVVKRGEAPPPTQRADKRDTEQHLFKADPVPAHLFPATGEKYPAWAGAVAAAGEGGERVGAYEGLPPSMKEKGLRYASEGHTRRVQRKAGSWNEHRLRKLS